jgi:hypothetical protein
MILCNHMCQCPNPTHWNTSSIRSVGTIGFSINNYSLKCRLILGGHFHFLHFDISISLFSISSWTLAVWCYRQPTSSYMNCCPVRSYAGKSISVLFLNFSTNTNGIPNYVIDYSIFLCDNLLKVWYIDVFPN